MSYRRWTPVVVSSETPLMCSRMRSSASVLLRIFHGRVRGTRPILRSPSPGRATLPRPRIPAPQTIEHRGVAAVIDDHVRRRRPGHWMARAVLSQYSQAIPFPCEDRVPWGSFSVPFADDDSRRGGMVLAENVAETQRTSALSSVSVQ